MHTFELAPGIVMDQWIHDRDEVVRADSAAAVEFRTALVGLRHRLDSLIDTPEGVNLVITAEMTETVRGRNPDYETFTDVRGSGTVGGKTMVLGERIDVILNGGWLLTLGGDGFVVNKPAIQMAGNTLAHEAQHVVMHQRGTCIDDVDRAGLSGRATLNLYEYGLRIADEYRAEAAAFPLRTGPVEKSGFGVMASAMATDIVKALAAYDEEKLDERELMIAVMGACAPLWVGLSYLAASLRKPDGSIAPLPPALAKSRLWVRYVGDLWPKLAGIFKVIPDATQECSAELLKVIARGMVEVARALLGQVGFTLIDGDSKDTAMFLITRRDFPR